MDGESRHDEEGHPSIDSISKTSSVDGELEHTKSLNFCLDTIKEFVDDESIISMIDLQSKSIHRLETTNASITNCVGLAQNKFAAINKLYKKTAKSIMESKADLDAIHKKISDLKNRIPPKDDIRPCVDP